jgi:hypothetical protein
VQHEKKNPLVAGQHSSVSSPRDANCAAHTGSALHRVLVGEVVGVPVGLTVGSDVGWGVFAQHVMYSPVGVGQQFTPGTGMKSLHDIISPFTSTFSTWR